MTKRRFSSQQLYTLRNDINVQMLIEKTLRIACRVSEGCFRFLCPLCKGFDTAVNPKTNLARCFHCAQNFNTIDLVMLVRQADFVQSAKFLQSIHQKKSVCQDRGDLGTISGNNLQSGSQMKPKTSVPKSNNDPYRIGKILGSILPIEHGDNSEKRSAEYRSNEPVASDRIANEDRIEKLEHQLKFMARQIEKIAQAINAGHPSKSSVHELK